jgi:ribosomal protein L24
MIYVEARSAKQVQQAVQGLVGVYISRGIQLVPIEEMASLLTIKKQEQTVQEGTWVRIKRGKYAGDLAQVMDVTENGEDVGLRFVPRIDLTPRDENAMDVTKKRKKAIVVPGSARPPQKLFNFEEVTKIWGRKSVHHKRGNIYIFQNDTYRDGFIEKDFKISALGLEDVNPTLDEISQFMRKQEGMEQVVDLSIIAEASKKAAIGVLQPGDHIEVFEGEQTGVHGIVEEINGDIVTITAMGTDIEGQKVDLQARSVKKRFKPGDHVKVMTGQNAGETGLVFSVTDTVVTFISDMTMQEVSACTTAEHHSPLTFQPRRFLCSRRICERLQRSDQAQTRSVTTSFMTWFNSSLSNLLLVLCLGPDLYPVPKPLVSFSKLSAIRSGYWTRMVKSDSCSLTKSLCVAIPVGPSLPTVKDTNCGSTTASRKSMARYAPLFLISEMTTYMHHRLAKAVSCTPTNPSSPSFTIET